MNSWRSTRGVELFRTAEDATAARRADANADGPREDAAEKYLSCYAIYCTDAQCSP
jgi:hypothetical protein